MKKLIFIALALAILVPSICRAEVSLFGTTDQEKIKVAEKSSPFYGGHIKIQIVPSFPEDAFKMGSTRFYSNGYKDIRMRAWGYDNYDGGYTFEFTMNHEICHYNYPAYTEEQCDDLADRMINFVNSLY